MSLLVGLSFFIHSPSKVSSAEGSPQVFSAYISPSPFSSTFRQSDPSPVNHQPHPALP